MASSPAQGIIAASVNIGGPVVGGVANSVLCVGATGLLASNANLGWNGSTLAVTGAVTVSSTLTLGTTAKLVEDAANVLALRNGTTAQTLAIYNTYTDSTHYERLDLYWTANLAIITPTKGSAGGTGRSLYVFGGASASLYLGANATYQYLVGTGDIHCTADNTNDLGQSSTVRWRDIYLGGYVRLGSADTLLTSESAAVLQMGADVNGAPVTQTIKAHDGITGTDIAGADFVHAGGRGTGSGTPGNFIVSVATELATGTTAQTLAAILTLSGGNNASVRNHFTYTAPTGDLAMTASTESIGMVIGGTATYTREWATGALALQREAVFQAPTYAFVGDSTLTDAITLAVNGPPGTGAHATITRKWIATFGTIAAPTFSNPTTGVGFFAAGSLDAIFRDTSGGCEFFVHTLAADGVIIGASTAHAVSIRAGNAERINIANGPAITFPTSASLLTFPTVTATGGAGVGTITNVPNAGGGNPAVYLRISVNGTTYGFPGWAL